MTYTFGVTASKIMAYFSLAIKAIMNMPLFTRKRIQQVSIHFIR